MQLRNISLKALSVNAANDRHGELASEDAAIEWLLTRRANHMRNLAKDIVNEGAIYEPPLVHEDGRKYVVYDGNRRVTCLKLLAEPHKSPSKDWAEFFTSLRSGWVGPFPTKVQCQIEQDRDRLDENLYRRHTGGQSGVGQSQWDPEAKSNFERRTGKKTKVNVAEEIEKRLKGAGYLGGEQKVPRSNLNRLLSAETFRNRVGISVVKNHIELTHNESVVLPALSKIAKDLMSRKVVLDDVWDNEAKRKYLDRLESKGILPTVSDALTKNVGFGSTKPSKKQPTPSPTPAPQNIQSRQTLIRHQDYGLVGATHAQRALDIWSELQHRLKFGEHDNAIAVLFRVLMELAIENYIARKSVSTVHANDKLANKFRKVIEDMENKGEIDSNYAKGLRKFSQQEALFSTHTLHAYVHSKNFFPSDIHLKSMWDTVSEFVVLCLKA